MGQFYKGTEATFLDDAMFKLPYELMGTVIDKKDKQVETAIESNDALNGMIEKIAALQGVDEEKAKLIRQGYSSQIEDITSSIYNDAMNASAYVPKINNLKKKIGLDFTSGEVAKIQGNKANYDAWEEELKAKVKAKPDEYDADMVKRLTAAKLAQFNKAGGTGYDATGDYKSVSTEDALGLKNSAEILKELMEGSIKGYNKSTSWNQDKGGWTVKSDTAEEFYTPAQLQNMWVNHLSTNPGIISAVKQRKDLGYAPYQGSFDDKGAVSFDEGSWFKTSMDQLQEKYGGHKTTTGGGSTMNTLGYAIAKDEHDTVNLTTEVGGALTSIAGRDNNQFYGAYTSTTNNQNQAVTKGLQAYADLYYKSDKKDPIEAANDRLEQFRTSAKNNGIYEKIRKGDFTPIANTPTGKAAQTQYKRAQVDRAALNSQIAQFNKETGLSYYDVKNNPETLKRWNKFLGDNATKPVNRQMTWEGTGMTDIQKKAAANEFFKGGKHMNVPIYFEPGTKIGGIDVGGTNGAKYSLNDLITKGVIKMVKVDTPTGFAGDTGIATQFQAVNGKEFINLDTSERNLTPIWGYNDSDDIEFGFGVSVGGKTHFGRVDGVSTEITRRLNSGDNALRFKTTAYLDKNAGNVENFQIPNSNYVYHGKAVKSGNKIIYPAGSVTRTVNGKAKTDYLTTAGLEIEVGHLLFD